MVRERVAGTGPVVVCQEIRRFRKDVRDSYIVSHAPQKIGHMPAPATQIEHPRAGSHSLLYRMRVPDVSARPHDAIDMGKCPASFRFVEVGYADQFLNEIFFFLHRHDGTASPPRRSVPPKYSRFS